MYETIKTIARAEKKTAEQISFYLDNLALGEYIEKYLPDADVKEAKEIFLDSSMVERTAVNRDVVGSSPTWGA